MRVPPKNQTLSHLCTVFVFIAFLTFPGIASAGTYWVSPTGAASWANCSGSTPLSGSSACSLATANTNAAAGDTVYLRGGTYSTGVSPSRSGTCASTCLGGVGANRITFAAYTGETPVISGLSIGLSIGGNWVKVTGLTFQNITTRPFWISGSYNEIANNKFLSIPPNYTTSVASIGTSYSVSGPWATHNWFHHNYLSTARNTNPCGEAIDLMRVGQGQGSCGNRVPMDNYNTIEDNYLEYGGHSTLDVNSEYNVFRRNTLHNEPFIAGCTSTGTNEPVYDNPAYNGLYGHRNIQTADSDICSKSYALYENNRIGFASPNPNNGGSSNIDVTSPGNIIRYNFIYGGMDSGIYFKYAGNGEGGVNNYIYNNTLYANGKGWNAGIYGHGNLAYNGQGIAQYSSNGAATNNVIKNNINYENGYSGQWDICYLGWYPGTNCSVRAGLDTISNNWITSSGDPQFTNPALTDPKSQNLFSSVHGYTLVPIPDLTLQSNSPAIDSATWLTNASNAGATSTSLVVADAWYFQDGTWGSDLSRGVTLFPDWIAIGTSANTVQIASVNYATNTIRLASPMTWSNGDHIWLYKKSDGEVVLNGSAPDYGASEYGTTTGTRITPPSGLQAVVH